LGKPGRLANLYFAPEETWIAEEVHRLAQLENVSATEMYMRLIDEGLADIRKPLGQVLTKHGANVKETLPEHTAKARRR